jgi:hypothetical protein
LMHAGSTGCPFVRDDFQEEMGKKANFTSRAQHGEA